MPLNCPNFSKNSPWLFLPGPRQSILCLNLNLLLPGSCRFFLCLTMFLSDTCHYFPCVASKFGETETELCVSSQTVQDKHNDFCSDSPRTSDQSPTPGVQAAVLKGCCWSRRECGKSKQKCHRAFLRFLSWLFLGSAFSGCCESLNLFKSSGKVGFYNRCLFLSVAVERQEFGAAHSAIFLNSPIIIA